MQKIVLASTTALFTLLSSSMLVSAKAQENTLRNNPASSLENSLGNSASSSATTSETNSDRFKTVILNVSGVPQRLTFQRFDRIGFPATTYFPASYFTVSGGCTDRGCGIGFFSRPTETDNTEGNFVRFFFPRQMVTVDQLRQIATTGEQSLLKLNPSWTVTETTTENLELPWMREITNFVTPNNGKGRIILGEFNGKAFGILEIYQNNREAEFQPLFQAVYENLEFKPQM